MGNDCYLNHSSTHHTIFSIANELLETRSLKKEQNNTKLKQYTLFRYGRTFCDQMHRMATDIVTAAINGFRKYL